MSSRDQILSSVRRRTTPEVALPSLDGPWIRYDDRCAQLADMLQAVGAQMHAVADREAINAQLAKLPAYSEANRICSLVEGVGQSNVNLEEIDDPHELADVDFAILSGQFAVAENGAIWLDDRGLRHRALPFIAQHLALITPASEIVDNMHQAYERIGFEQPGFGVFISGPSKTADVEQSLVIGAHGARSLTVFLVEEPTA